MSLPSVTYSCGCVMTGTSVGLNERVCIAHQLAGQEASRLGHPQVGTLHLLLGLLKEGKGEAAKMLRGHGITLRKIRSALEVVR